MIPLVLSARAAAALLTHWRDGSSGPAYSALADAVRVLAIDGRVAVGTRLPAERQLADALGVSRTTVASAYALLRDDGFLRSTRGSGSVLRLPSAVAGRPDPDHLAAPVDGDLLDLRKAALHAAPGVAEAAVRAVQGLPAALVGNGYDTVGDPGLRAAIADRYTTRGLPTTADQVLVTLGAQHAIALLARVLVRRGTAVLIESPTYPHAHEAFRAAGARLVAVPVDAHDGWDGDALVSALRRSAPAVAYLMPDLHNPTAATMPSALREAVLAAAADAGTVVIADETMAELRIDGDVVPPFATAGPAVLIGSAGKVFWGGLRVGWIRADPALLQRLVLARPTGDLGTPAIEQRIVRELVPDTAAALEARRTFLRAARDTVVAGLRDRVPEWEVPAPAGGLSTWVRLGRPVSSALVLAARAEGLVLTSGGAFGPHGGFEGFLRVPYAVPADAQVRLVEALGRAWTRLDSAVRAPGRPIAAVV
ncbi:PLP-dependent aminotransferase family protein [Curtobacterium sp. MCBD17_040]|uniref:MocR-like transcription factor YczR n=1 Tax=Curtobacterium sp. MCBD17_040 TaxID=2175674 RepID=UPI0021AD25B4|nr:PLP-dependent aminotransferase family protein [Curtobacterium sp. MCBD17_040]WIB64890.1 PLP-dependent aminotransferase family protein [Curtobacterium sp. MCBD17_040]